MIFNTSVNNLSIVIYYHILVCITNNITYQYENDKIKLDQNANFAFPLTVFMTGIGMRLKRLGPCRGTTVELAWYMREMFQM